jgi:hypothetical protein
MKKLKLKRFEYDEKKAPEMAKCMDKHRSGFLAQDLEKIIPKAVSKGKYPDINLEEVYSINTD